MRKPQSAQIRRITKRLLLYAMRTAGVFAMARRLSRSRLRILCYHGFSIGDQHEYAPIMFMRPAVFARRLALLKRLNYVVLPLAEALEKLHRGDINRGEVVITIDDGWKSTLTLAAPLLLEHAMPACLYLTTYHVERAEVVTDVVIEYMFWRTARTTLSVRGIAADLDGDFAIPGNERALAARWAGFGNKQCDAAGRQKLVRTLAALLDLDYDTVTRNRRFALIDAADVAELQRCGVDIQLHTHTHTFPSSDQSAAAEEILQNRRVLERIGAGRATHFCYPSGRYAPQHPEWLAALGIESAMTCDVGSNHSGHSPFLLKRYLDRDDAREIEFEAELSGVSDLLRSLRGTIGRPPETPK